MAAETYVLYSCPGVAICRSSQRPAAQMRKCCGGGVRFLSLVDRLACCRITPTGSVRGLWLWAAGTLVIRSRSTPRTASQSGCGIVDLGVTAPDTQLGGDTTDLRVLGVGLKLVGIRDIGDRERLLFDAFAVDERESAELVERVVADAASGLEGIQFITDQGTPYVAEAAQQAYEALGVEHAPQREGTPTEKATVERGFATVTSAIHSTAKIPRCSARSSSSNAKKPSAASASAPAAATSAPAIATSRRRARAVAEDWTWAENPAKQEAARGLRGGEA